MLEILGPEEAVEDTASAVETEAGASLLGSGEWGSGCGIIQHVFEERIQPLLNRSRPSDAEGHFIHAETVCLYPQHFPPGTGSL